MTEQFELEFSYGAKVVFEHEQGSNMIKAVNKDQDGNPTDEIYLNHNAKLRLIKWLMNTIND